MKRILIIAGGTALGILAVIFIIASLSGGSSGWAYNVSTDPVTDAKSAAANLQAEGSRASLELSCKPGQPISLVIDAGERMGGFRSEENYVDRTVQYRLDKAPPQDVVGILGDNYIGFSRGSDEKKPWDTAIIAGMRKAERLAIAAEGNNGRVALTFDITGADDVIDRLTAECRQN
jgi:hypothetical protein